MAMTVRECADKIIHHSLQSVLPDRAVCRAIEQLTVRGRLLLVAAGKAAWQMAAAAQNALGSRIEAGVVITKYGHVKGELAGIRCFEAGHPIVDENSVAATEQALQLVQNLTADDTVLFLLSGGGSALFEKPLIPLAELADINAQLLRSGADITEINTVRKRLSAVKAGRFALACAPAQVFSVMLSDVLGDPLDVIASGPAYPDSSTAADALRIAKKYSLLLSEQARQCLSAETPKTLSNVQTHVTGSVRQLCQSAAEACKALGYEPVILTDSLCCEAREAGQMLAERVRAHSACGVPTAFIAGGETVVRVTGQGLGGRNQELALAAAKGIAGLADAAVFSVGSDGTDGPTDAAGGYVDGDTQRRLAEAGLDIDDVLSRNDSYHALKVVDGLIFTGPTGTNVNDVAVALVGLPQA
ncbi:MAG: glycerate kinase [Oscillospiraceae bacterium]|nr:glycerate kinase [Oscillospiraceae bacterium]